MHGVEVDFRVHESTSARRARLMTLVQFVPGLLFRSHDIEERSQVGSNILLVALICLGAIYLQGLLLFF